MRITESQLRNIIKKQVTKQLNEKFYDGEYDRTGCPLDDKSYIDSYEYIIDSIINGNWQQAQELSSKLTFQERMELLNYAQEIGYEKDVKKLFSYLNEAIDGGWVVEESQADEAYDLFVEYFGKEQANQAIVDCISKEELASCLAFIFRQYDFDEWKKFN